MDASRLSDRGPEQAQSKSLVQMAKYGRLPRRGESTSAAHRVTARRAHNIRELVMGKRLKLDWKRDRQLGVAVTTSVRKPRGRAEGLLRR